MQKILFVLFVVGIIPLLFGCDGKRKDAAAPMNPNDYNFRGTYPITFKGTVNRTWWESMGGPLAECPGKDEITLTFEEPNIVTMHGVHACYTNGCDIKPGDKCGYTLKGKYTRSHGISRFTITKDIHDVYVCNGKGTYNSKMADISFLKCTLNGNNRLSIGDVSIPIQ